MDSLADRGPGGKPLCQLLPAIPWPVVRRFLVEWQEAADWLLSCGLRHPVEFAEVTGTLNLDGSSMPDPPREIIFRWIVAAGISGIDIDEATLVHACRREGEPIGKDRLREVIHHPASETIASMWDAARAVWEFAKRYDCFGRAEFWLIDPRPLGEIVERLYRDVVVTNRRACSVRSLKRHAENTRLCRQREAELRERGPDDTTEITSTPLTRRHRWWKPARKQRRRKSRRRTR